MPWCRIHPTCCWLIADCRRIISIRSAAALCSHALVPRGLKPRSITFGKKRQPFYLDTRPLIGPRHLGSNVDRSRYGRQRPDLGHGSPVEGFKTFEKYGRGSRHHARNEQKKHNRFRNLGVNRVQTTECAPHRFLYRFQHRHCHAQRADEALCRLCWRQARRCRRNILSA